MRINLIVAVDSNGGISKNNEIPWDIKEDMNFFHDVTKRVYTPNKKNVMIMGKNTWKKIPAQFRGLKDRITVVISTQMNHEELDQDNTTKTEAYLSKSLDEALTLCQTLNHCDKVFICGGASVYKAAMCVEIDEIYLTQIDYDYGCDNLIDLDDLDVEDLKKPYSAHSFMVQDHKNNIQVKATFKKFYNNHPPHLNVNPEEQQYLNLLENILNTGLMDL